MSSILTAYKSKYHFSVNFYSLFLIVTFLPDLAGISAPAVKYTYWGIKVLLAIWVIWKDKRPFGVFGTTEILFIILAVVYLTRIFMDVFLASGTIADTDWTYAMGVVDFSGFAIGIIIALSFRYDPLYHSPASFNFFWITLTIALVMSYFLAKETFDLDVHNIRYNANSTINSIMYGQTGCALALVSLIGISGKGKWVLKIIFAATLLLGLISIAKAGSRSPVIVFIVVGAIYLLARLGKFKGLLIVAITVLTIAYFLPLISSMLESMGSSLGTRLTSMIVEKESSGRDYIYANAWKLIQEYPLFGSYYVIQSGTGAGGYPHNFILEVFMATGLAGGIPFLILLVISVIKCIKIISFNSSASWIAVLYLQVIVYGMFSTGLYTSQDFWTMLFFFTSMNVSVYYIRKPEEQPQYLTAVLKLEK